MKNLKTYESFLAQAGGSIEYPNPEEVLEGDDLTVWNIISRLSHELNSIEEIQSSMERQQMEPIITTIIDQTNSGYDFEYYMMVSNYGNTKGFVEIEANLKLYTSEIYFSDVRRSTHGYPTSYGHTVFEYNQKTGEISWDKDFFQPFIR
jgi:hypothetical protein